jgi:hypothetical protein
VAHKKRPFAQSEQFTFPGGKCGEQGHSMRTCAQMKAVSAARLKEVLAYGKAQSSNVPFR